MTEGAPSDKTAVREFRVSFPDAELTELRRRINATRWPERRQPIEPLLPSEAIRLMVAASTTVPNR